MKRQNAVIDLEELLQQLGLGDMEAGGGLPDPSLLMFYKNLANREIWLDDSITVDTLEISKLILYFNKQDEGIPIEDRKPIKIFIYSYGGEVSACFNVIDTIGMSKTPIYTYNMGIAMSAAFLILIAGHKRFATKRAVGLIHSGSGGTQGTYEQTEAQMKDYKHAVSVMREFILERTNIDQKLLTKNKSTEWYLYKDDLINYGIVDKIIESADEL